MSGKSAFSPRYNFELKLGDLVIKAQILYRQLMLLEK